MTKQKKIVIAILFFSLASVVASLFISSEATSRETQAFHTLFAISLVVMALHGGAALLLTSGLSAFRAHLRTAYIFYCWGFVALGVTFLQSPLLSLLDMWDSAYVETGILALPFLAAALLLYMGSRRFARLIGIKNGWTSFWVVTLSAVVFAALVFVVPHPYVGVDDMSAEGGSAITALLAVYLGFAAVLTTFIRRKASADIAQATKWLLFALLASTVAALQHSAVGLYLPHDHWYVAYGVSFLLHILGGALALKAAYNFSCIESKDVRIEIEDNQENKSGALNAVLLLAGLVSRVQDIDLILDKVRSMTSYESETGIFSDDEQRQLGIVFLEIEKYLIEEEPLRQFDKTSLRSTIRQSFSTSVDLVFWEAIGESSPQSVSEPENPKLPTPTPQATS